jgi:CYTH domain-containing protein/predicted ATPase
VFLKEFFDMASKVDSIVITGGPCSGKTTALAAISQFCQNIGKHPVIIPEVATDLIVSGFDRTKPEFQELVVRKLRFEEMLRLEAAAAGHFPAPPVLIYDRGYNDCLAYVSEKTFLSALALNQLDFIQARDQYSGVIFLDSAAVGAEDFYTLKNNVARTENIAEARVLNERTKNAWAGTPHFQLIPNRLGVGFDEKITECLQALARFLGVPVPLEYERKFKLEGFDLSMLPSHAVPVTIIQTYLIGKSGTVERVRARGYGPSFLYFNTIKVRQDDGGSHELDHLIDKHEYDTYLLRHDVSRLPVHKTRYCFLYGEHYCELDIFHGHLDGLALLEVEVHNMEQAVSVPSYLGPYTDVTESGLYANYRLALPNAKW